MCYSLANKYSYGVNESCDGFFALFVNKYLLLLRTKDSNTILRRWRINQRHAYSRKFSWHNDTGNIFIAAGGVSVKMSIETRASKLWTSRILIPKVVRGNGIVYTIGVKERHLKADSVPNQYQNASSRIIHRAC